MRRIALGVAAVAALTSHGPASAQAADPLVAGARAQFNVVSNFVVRAAEKVPEDLYDFRPTPEVRSFADLFGHVADGYFEMCGVASGSAPPRAGVEASVKDRAGLVQALNEGAEYCRSVLAAMDDGTVTETVPFYFGQTPRLSVLYFAVAHAYEHYGNLVTYMRLNGIVPPSSESSGG